MALPPCAPNDIAISSDVNEFPKELFTEYQLEHGAILIHVISSVYIFYVMFIICDEYLVPAIESLCEAFQIPSHIAGASFLAASSSIPELFVNIFGTFLTKNDLGIGTVLASAFFNLLVIVALTAFGTSILGTSSGASYNKIAGWPLSRDSIVYGIALSALCIVIWDQRVYWYEALVLVMLYILYIFGLVYNNKLERSALKASRWFSRLTKRSDEINEKTPIMPKNEVEDDETETKEKESSSERDLKNIAEEEKQDRELIRKALQDDYKDFQDGHRKGKWASLFPSSSVDGTRETSCLEWIHNILILPAKFLILLTVPDCRSENNRKWFPLTLIMSIVWVGTLSYLASWMLTRFGSTLGLPDSILGIFLAFGASFPEILSSFIVARKGLGTMGLSNPIGSNTFDILICLGLPWTFQGLSKSSKFVPVYSSGVSITVFLLLISLFLLYVVLVANKLKLDLTVGSVALGIYIVMITFVCLIELNVFFDTTTKKFCAQNS